jgi:hypothetical protein
MFFFFKVARAGERTRLTTRLILFIFSFHHFTGSFLQWV